MRDPRIDPRANDVLRKGESIVTVIFTSPQGFGFRFEGSMKDTPPMVPWDRPYLPHWRRWAKRTWGGEE